MKFDHTKHNIKQLTCDLKFLGEMIGMADKQVLEHLKDRFLPNNWGKFLETKNMDLAIGKARALVLLFKWELPQAVLS